MLKFFKEDPLLATLIATGVAVFALLMILFVASIKTAADHSRKFDEVCTQAGGVTVFNGRHYECITKASNKN